MWNQMPNSCKNIHDMLDTNLHRIRIDFPYYLCCYDCCWWWWRWTSGISMDSASRTITAKAISISNTIYYGLQTREWIFIEENFYQYEIVGYNISDRLPFSLSFPPLIRFVSNVLSMVIEYIEVWRTRQRDDKSMTHTHTGKNCNR